MQPKGNIMQVSTSQPPHPFLLFPLYLDTQATTLKTKTPFVAFISVKQPGV
jgi:hypothetical protein